MKKKILTLLVIIISFILYLIIGEHFSLYIDCPIKKLTGLYCPGCGITRMFFSILQLDFYQAFRYNPLVFISLPFFIFFYLQSLFTKKEPLYNKVPTKVWVTLIIIFIIYGILRNVPFFTFLAPTVIR